MTKLEASNYPQSMEAELNLHLQTICASYVAATKLKASTVAMRAARDARFFDRLESGGGFTAKTYDTVMLWFSDHWPDGAEWPVDVPRPARAASQTDVAAE